MAKPYDKYSEVYDFLFENEIDYDKDVAFVKKLITPHSYQQEVTVLDLGCGTGTHAIKLAKEGFKVIGIDISEKMIKRAIEKAKKEDVFVEFLVQDMKKVNIPTKVDCAISLFGSFSYLLSNADLKKFFGSLNRYLKKGGFLVLDIVNREGASKGRFLKWRLKEKGNKIVIRLNESELDEKTGLIKGVYHFLIIENRRLIDRFTEIHTIRTYALDEIKKILQDYGYTILNFYSWPLLDEKVSEVKKSFVVRVVAKKIV